MIFLNARDRDSEVPISECEQGTTCKDKPQNLVTDSRFGRQYLSDSISIGCRRIVPLSLNGAKLIMEPLNSHFNRESLGSLVSMDGIASDRFVNRMPSMVDWASGQRAAASSSPLPLIDGHDVDNLAMGIIVFGLGAWEDLAKLTGNSVSSSQHRYALSLVVAMHECIPMSFVGSISLDILPSNGIFDCKFFSQALENEMIAKRMMEMHPGLKDALALSPGSSRLVSNALRAAASSLQLNDELMHDEISLGEPHRII